MSAAGLLAGVLCGAALYLALPPAGREPVATRRPRPTRWPASPAGSRRSRGEAALPVAVFADLVAALLRTGLPPAGALSAVESGAAEVGLAVPEGLEPVLDAIRLAEVTGLAPAGLVRAAAAERRRDDLAAAEVAARRLAVLVVLPMGLCLLPAFVLLTVAPLVLGLILR